MQNIFPSAVEKKAMEKFGSTEDNLLNRPIDWEDVSKEFVVVFCWRPFPGHEAINAGIPDSRKDFEVMMKSREELAGIFLVLKSHKFISREN